MTEPQLTAATSTTPYPTNGFLLHPNLSWPHSNLIGRMVQAPSRQVWWSERGMCPYSSKAVWGGLDGTALLEEACQIAGGIRVKTLPTFNLLFFPPYFTITIEGVSAQLPALVTMPLASMTHPSGTMSPKKLFYKSCLGYGVLSQKQRSNQ